MRIRHVGVLWVLAGLGLLAPLVVQAAAPKPDAPKPPAAKQDVKKPAAPKQDTKQPAAPKQSAKKPDPPKPDPKKPAAPKPVVKKPAPPKPDAKKPVAPKPTPPRQTAKTPAAPKQEAKKPPPPKAVAGEGTLVFPVTASLAGAKPAPAAECVVAFGPPVAVSAMAFSPDGKQLAVGAYQEVLLWDVAEGKLTRRIGTGQLAGRVGALAFLEKGKQLAVGEAEPGKPGAVKLFDTAGGKLLATLKEPPEAVQCMAVSPDGKYLAAGGAYNDVHVWTVKDRKLATTIRGHNGWVTDLCFSPDGKQLATASADKMVLVWHIGKWDQVVRLPHTEPVHGVAFGPDNRSLMCAVGGLTEWAVRLRRTDNARSNRAYYPGAGMPLALLWAAKTSRIYVAGSDKTVKIMQTNGRVYGTCTGHTDWVYAVALSPDAKKLASGSRDGTVRLWNPTDGKPLATLVQLAPRTDQWLFMTAPGYLATSSAGALQWQPTGKPVPADKLLAALQNTESIRKVLAGAKVAPPVLK